VSATLRKGFLRWQARVRQTAMRDNSGRPDEGSMPALIPAGDTVAMGQIVTVLCKEPQFSVTPELQHIYRSTMDPAKRRQRAIEFFSATHFQKTRTFSDILTATFPPESHAARSITRAGRCTLIFKAYGQRFDLPAAVSQLQPQQPLFEATWWHNALFNPNLPSDTQILGFTPDWTKATADPVI